MPHAYTPGPWTYHAKQHDGFDGPSIQSEYGLICSMPTPEDSEGKTNARLIAAAPDCLRVLKLLVNCQNYCMDDSKVSYELQAVLAEAENVIATATDCTVRRLPK